MTSRFDILIVEAINNALRAARAQPLFLGGVSGSGGGYGGPPGGFVGKLPQTRIAFDSTEAEIGNFPNPVSSGTLVDNLNRIRYRLHQLENMTFLNLTDTPDTYSGYDGYHVTVSGNGLVFSPPSGGSSPSTFISLSDTPASYAMEGSKFVRVNTDETALEFGNINPDDLPAMSPNSILITNNTGTITTGNLHYYAGDNTVVVGVPSVPVYGTNSFTIIAPSGSTGVSQWAFSNVNSPTSNMPFIVGFRARGSLSNPGTIQAGDGLMRIAGRGYDGVDWSATQAQISFVAADNWTVSNHASKIEFYVTPPGKTVVEKAGEITSDKLLVMYGIDNGWHLETTTATVIDGFSFQISGDYTQRYRFGTRIKWYENGASTHKFGVVVSSAYNSGVTTVTLATNNDFSLSEITALWFSYDVMPYGFPAWFSWLPTWTGSGSMTVTATVQTCKFKIVGTTVYFYIGATVTLGGTASVSVRASAPTGINSTAFSPTLAFTAAIRDSNSGSAVVGKGTIASPNIVFQKSDVTNWTLGAGRLVGGTGFYEMV